MAPLWTVGLLFAVCVVPRTTGTYCFTYHSIFEKYCEYGCCSNACCAEPGRLESWGIGLIVAGSIVFICIVVAVLYCCIKSQGHAGRVVRTQPQSGVTVISSGQQQSSYGNQGYVYNSGNPGYTQAWSYPPVQSAPPPPPAYGFAPAAYPPGQSNDPFAAAASSKH